MEKVIILSIVCGAFILLILKVKKMFKREGYICDGCGSVDSCKSQNDCPGKKTM